MLISNHLRYALAKEELAVFFQPKIELASGRIVGAEALLRWHSPELGNIPPDVFIPLAENLGLIHELGTWILEASCREARRWQDDFYEKLQVSVNVSPQQFRAGLLLEAVAGALAHSGLPHHLLELEITESLLMQDSDKPFSILKNGPGVFLQSAGAGGKVQIPPAPGSPGTVAGRHLKLPPVRLLVRHCSWQGITNCRRASSSPPGAGPIPGVSPRNVPCPAAPRRGGEAGRAAPRPG
jgi:hypothetical protein